MKNIRINESGKIVRFRGLGQAQLTDAHIAKYMFESVENIFLCSSLVSEENGLIA